MTRSRNPRVLRVTTRLNVGGPSRHVLLLNRTLEDLGYDLELVTGREEPGEGRLTDERVRFDVLDDLRKPLNPWRDLAAYRSLARRMRGGDIDIVHTHLAKAGAVGRLAAHRTKIPIVVHTFHGHVLEGYFSKAASRAFVATERRLATWSDALIAVSATIRDELLDLGIGRPDQWRVVPVGLELGHLLEDGPSKEEARRSLGLPSGGTLIGAVGRLVPIKDLETFFLAAAKVIEDRPDVRVVVAGDGESRAALEERARELLGSRVHFLGWTADLPALYRGLDLAVLTSRNEGTPTSLIEAAASGRPVVATRVGGVPDVVRDGTTGMLAAPGDVDGIAAMIAELLADPSRAEALGAAGRDWVRDRFSAERVTGDIDSLYRELLERKAGPYAAKGRIAGD